MLSLFPTLPKEINLLILSQLSITELNSCRVNQYLNADINHYFESDYYWNLLLLKDYNLTCSRGAKGLYLLLETSKTNSSSSVNAHLIARVCIENKLWYYLDILLENRLVKAKNVSG